MELDIEGDILPSIEEEDELRLRQNPSLQPAEPAVYLPAPTSTTSLAADETLAPDQSVYEMLHTMSVTWPCLSFDVLQDNLGWERRRYPATAFIVAGTQADAAKNNEVLVMKLRRMHKTQRDDDDDGMSIFIPLFI
jgi:ribosome assembly protein RRB1